MERENRYYVLKRKDIEKYLNADDKARLARIARDIELSRAHEFKADFQCVVVEHDWPEYEPTWAAIEARMTGATTPVSADLIEEVARLRGALKDIVEMTDADDPESYRCDDREGCLETVFATAIGALTPNDQHNRPASAGPG